MSDDLSKFDLPFKPLACAAGDDYWLMREEIAKDETPAETTDTELLTANPAQ